MTPSSELNAVASSSLGSGRERACKEWMRRFSFLPCVRILRWGRVEIGCHRGRLSSQGAMWSSRLKS
jgi:hypothetical protein